MRTVVILQSNYLPWQGYMDLMRACDLFLLFDIVQYTKNDWRNRNRIKTANGPIWLTIPVSASLSNATPIEHAMTTDRRWVDRHIRSIRQAYARAPYLKSEGEWLFEELDELRGETCLSAINARLLLGLASRLGIATPIVQCTDFLPREELVAASQSARLLALCQATGATRYLSGPAAKSYLDSELFGAAGIEVSWMRYNYANYPQLHGPFLPNMSVVDLLLNTGPDAYRYFDREVAQ
jgi:hypothetical protein